MKLKKILGLGLAAVILVSAVGCSSSKGEKDSVDAADSSEDKKIVVGASATPHAEILEEIKPLVEAKGYEVVSGANTQCEKYLRDTLKSVFSKI